MKKTLIFGALIFIAVTAVVSCKKDHAGPSILQLSYADSAKVIAVQKGKVIYISLGIGNNPAYRFGDWQYDTSILQLVSHQHANPPDPKIIGSAGTDTWTFNTLAIGTTSLKLSNAGSLANNVPLFSGTIKVD